MPVAGDPPLTKELRETLGNLAEGLFDLAGWLRSPNKYVPPLPAAEMPWRAGGHRFTPLDLGVITFFEGELAASGEDDLFSRWAGTVDPLQASPLQDPSGWRANRGLANPALFGVGVNALLTNASGNPLSRRMFYASYWQPLRAAVAARQHNGPVDWTRLANDLATDQAPEWPMGSSRSSVFIMQFVSDLLAGMLGMSAPVSAPMRDAVLVELGEHRRRGNHYEPAAADRDVQALRALLKQLTAAPPPAPAQAPVYVPPVGSPPHDKK